MRLEYRKALCQSEFEKSSTADHIRKEKGNHLTLCEEDWEEH